MIARALTAIGAAWCAAMHDDWAYAGGPERWCRTCFRRVMAPHHIAAEPRPQQPADARAVEATNA